MKQTAVEWLVEELSDVLGPMDTNSIRDLLLMDAINRAKEMEKEQMCEFADEFAIECINFHHEKTMSQEKFFDLTFNTNEK